MFADFTEEERAFRADVRELLHERLPDDWQGIFAREDDWQWSTEFCRELGRRGWLTQSWPTEHGGRDASIWMQLVMHEEMWAHNEPRGSQYMNVNWIGPAIGHFGSDAQKQFFLPKMAAGELLWAQGFSEPGAGSDLAALQTRAEVDGDELIVNGKKIWISYGDISDYLFLLCRSDPDSRRTEGLSVLLVDMKLSGIHVERLTTPLGLHRQTEITFDDVRVPGDALLGPLHAGWNVAMRALSFERSGNARYGRHVRILGILEREYGAEWGDTEVERFACALALARAAELVNYRVAAARESGDVSRGEASIARVHNVVLETEMADMIEDCAGLEAIVSGLDDRSRWNGEAEALWRNAPAGRITAGTFEIQLDLIAREAMQLER